MLPLPSFVVATLFAALGAVVGSFVALVAQRWPAGRPIAVARSVCDSCGAVLDAAELVPLLSFALQRGRCRRCGERIAWRHLAVEAGAAVIGAVSVMLLPLPIGAAVAALGWTLLLLALLDAEHFWLPSVVTWPLAAAGLGVTAALAPAALPNHVIGAVAGWASLAFVATVYKLLRGRVGLGGGDAKLFAASGAWLGWAALPTVLLAAALAGIVAALLRHGRGITATTRLPLGTFLAAATWAVALVTL